MNLEQVQPLPVPTWTKEHQAAASAEGWMINRHHLSQHFGVWQVQSLDDASKCPNADGSIPPQLGHDSEAWEVLANGKEPHHAAALLFLERGSPTEYFSIMKNRSKDFVP